MQYEVKSGQSIYDVAVDAYGSVSYVVKLCQDNGIDLDSDIEHLSLIYDPAIKNAVNPQFRINTIPPLPDKSYFVKEQQSIYDLALMFGYGLDRIAEFVSIYGWNLDSLDIAGQTILVTKIKTTLSQFVTLNNIKFATSPDDDTRVVWDGEYLIWDGTYLLTWS